MKQAPGASGRNRTLDLLKGIFIIFVITLHFPFAEGFTKKALFPYWVVFAVPAFLFISGYVSALSAQRKDSDDIGELYSPRGLFAKCLRFLVPYTIVFIFAQIIFRVTGLYQVGPVEYGLRALFFDYLCGGFGPGSYYVPMMIEFVFVFPLIYLLVKRRGFRGVLCVFGINIAYEIIKEAFGMDESEYRFLIFRYLFVVACGVYACVYGSGEKSATDNADAGTTGDKKRIDKTFNAVLMGCCVALGAAFVYIFSYTSYQPRILTYWSPTSVLPALYIVPVMFVIVRHVKIKFAPLELIGKASFNIFLVQMIFYIYYGDLIGDRFPMGAAYAISVAGCVAAGVLFYLAESRLTKAVTGLIKKKS